MAHGTKLRGTGPLSRLDPRVSVIVLTVWSVAVALVWSRPAALAGLGGSLVLFLLAGCDRPWRFVGRVLLINTFLIFVWLAIPFSFSTPGETVAKLGPLAVTREGLDLVATLSIKALAITCGAMSVTIGVGVFELTLGAGALGAPEKLVAMMALMNRYIRVVGEEFDRLIWAMRVRGFAPKATVHCLKAYANLAGSLLVRGFDRGDRVRAAMLCRGWSGKIPLDRDYELGRVDLLVSLVVLVMLVIMVALDVVH